MSYLPAGPWMTEPVRDQRLGVGLAVEDARAVLRGWSDDQARSVHRHLMNVARRSRSFRGAQSVERHQQKLVFAIAKLTKPQILAVQVLGFVAIGDAEHAKECHAELERQLRQLLMPDAWLGAKRRRQLKGWSAKGVEKHTKYGPAEKAQWQAIADRIIAAHSKRLSRRELARLVAEEFSNPKAKSSIRKYLQKIVDKPL